MSSPLNPLDQYHSYSYHFILLASVSSEALRVLVQDNKTFLTGVSGAVLGQEIGKDTGCYLITDTRKTSEFSIESLNFDAYIANASSPTDSVTLTSVINMRLVDPSGIGFYNYLKYLVDHKMQTDITGISFLLHIMFVGHSDTGKSFPLYDYNVSIPLVMMEHFNLAEYNTKGGVYDLGFVAGNMGGARGIQSYNKLYRGYSIRVKEKLLGNAIQSFENELNIRSKEWFLKFNPDFVKSDGTPSDNRLENQKEPPKHGRLVQYMITIPDSWFYFTLSGIPDNGIELSDAIAARAKVDGREIEYTTSDTKVAHDVNHSISAGKTIEEALKDILDICPQVPELANLDKKKAGKVRIYKILSSVTSNLETVLVHFDIVEYSVPNVNRAKEIQDNTNKQDKTPNRNDTKRPPHSWIFEYIFSGKNSDVVDFNIKANNLFLGLMTQGNMAQVVNNDIPIQNQKLKPDTQNILIKEGFGQVLKYQPLAVPPATSEELKSFSARPNVREPNAAKKMSDVQEFQKTLSDLHVTSMDSDLRIRGNPEFLGKYVVKNIPPHIVLGGSVKDFLTKDLNKSSAWTYDAQTKKAPTAGGEAIITSSHLEHRKYINSIEKEQQKNFDDADRTGTMGASSIATGTWIKVNVYGPSDYPFNFANGEDTSVFKKQFFYDSWYFVSAVNNSFEMGSFYQNIKIHAFDLYGNYGTANKQIEERK